MKKKAESRHDSFPASRMIHPLEFDEKYFSSEKKEAIVGGLRLEICEDEKLSDVWLPSPIPRGVVRESKRFHLLAPPVNNGGGVDRRADTVVLEGSKKMSN